MKSRRTRWGRQAACMGEKKVHRVSWWKNSREREHLEGPGVDGMVTLKY
jgi:hypothetical protein